ncbi:unnamed protein product [Aphanomyces euteiches]|uniref:Major facilitator superfamily (MFS) profile domain-containing protein n=1 Tax=Aphanomyces euteiches TaxID=100861 RepID=A0A6G0WCC9_9STRA|nr:hypothetical protein Ae201684_016496 [Aphanomyces euteiches]KAH9092995.1 hypothetical protein Ae201684P_008661 [Aphanomyces euteiches]
MSSRDGEKGELLPLTGPTSRYKSVIMSVCSFILVTEFCERFAYYGFTGSLPIFFRKHLSMSSVLATELNSVFTCFTYIMPLLGAYVADKYLGRYKSILSFSLWYLLGLALCTFASYPSIMSVPLFMVGLFGGVSMGVGGIKPNVVVLGADQFDVSDPAQRKERDQFFNWFYWSINVGSTFSYIFLTNLAVQGLPPLIPIEFGFFASFLVPTISFSAAIIVFFSGRSRYIKKPPQGSALSRFFEVLFCAGGKTAHGKLVLSGGFIFFPAIIVTTISYFVEDPTLHLGFALTGAAMVVYGTLVLVTSGQDTSWLLAASDTGLYSLGEVKDVAQVMRLSPYFGFLIVFWAVYAQQSMNFVLQGCQMDLRFGSTQVSSAMLSMFDAMVIFVFVPIFNSFIYPTIEKAGVKLTLLRKMGAGYIVAMLCMLTAGVIEVYRKEFAVLPGANSNCAQANEVLSMSSMSVWWQIPQYLLVGLSEILISIPSYDLFYSEVPESMRSVCQAMNLLTTTLGSLVAGGTNSIFSFWITSDLNDGHLEYVFYVFAALVLVNLLGFVFVSQGFEYHQPAQSTLDLVSGFSPALPRASRHPVGRRSTPQT